MVLRGIFRAPLGVFDVISNYRFTYPRTSNFYFIYASLALILYFGKGFEKMNMSGNQSSYENRRRARRLFVPYSLVSYKWRFPVSQ